MGEEHPGLRAQERIIERGQRTFVEVGKALRTIRSKRLWRGGYYRNFGDYCRERWGWSKRHANRVIAAAEVRMILGARGPRTETVARELAPLVRQPAKLKRVWARAQARAATPTARQVHQVVRRDRTRLNDPVADAVLTTLVYIERRARTFPQRVDRTKYYKQTLKRVGVALREHLDHPETQRQQQRRQAKLHVVPKRAKAS